MSADAMTVQDRAWNRAASLKISVETTMGRVRRGTVVSVEELVRLGRDARELELLTSLLDVPMRVQGLQ